MGNQLHRVDKVTSIPAPDPGHPNDRSSDSVDGVIYSLPRSVVTTSLIVQRIVTKRSRFIEIDGDKVKIHPEAAFYAKALGKKLQT